MKLICALLFALASSTDAADIDPSASFRTSPASRATNEFGLDLYHQLAKQDENLCLSPYSIETAVAMTFAGADGETREQMTHVLHFPKDTDAIHGSFKSLQQSLEEMAQKTAVIAEHSKKSGGPSEPIALAIANRLFGQTGDDFHDSFQQLVKKFYGGALEPLDFKKNPEAARSYINKWVADQTRDRIRNLIPADGIQATTRLVLANALYLKAPWAWEFSEAFTKPKPFRVGGKAAVDVATMQNVKQYGYAKRSGFTAVALPYSGNELQLVILIPDAVNGLPALEKSLTADLLSNCAKLDTNRDVNLSLPKFKIEPATIPLADNLKLLGMKSAFDEPPGSANFEKIAPRKPDDYLALSQVFHKTFIAVDEKGTEAAAATAVAMMARAAMRPKPKPIELKIDRPFVYAIQHVPSGACLFIGHVIDPR